MQAKTTGVATREEFLSYMNTTPGSEKAVYHLIGEGFSDLTETLNAKTKDSHYIHQRSGTSSVIGYAPTFNFTAELDKNDPVTNFVSSIGRERKIGADCETHIINVVTWLAGKTQGTMVAYKQNIAIKVDNSGSGIGGDVLALTGAFMYKGDAVKGEWNPATQEFIEPTTEAQA